ncbi:sugar transferase [Segatella sp.]|uniref:sugar transferase n=1 Tax=Segatella sp. TaxID=2974253 RepID=UPI0030799F42
MTKQNKTETKNRNNRMERFVKRSTDILVSVPCLVLFSPLFVIISLAIKWEDGLPIIYKQERIGLHGKPFNIYKFRSMKADAEKDGPILLEIEGDTRLTRVGKFIRAHHLDELPQLWNIVKGDMSLVGPRPERKYYIAQIIKHDPRYTYLYQIRPGATSYATLYNGYTDTMPKMLRRLSLDLYYLEHRSWWFDAKILFKTMVNILFGKIF